MSGMPETRYAATGGVHIAYQAIGSGSHDVVFANWGVNVEAMWDNVAVAASWQRLRRWARLIVFDPRGSGLSDRVPIGMPTVEDWGDDIARVLDAIGIKRATIMGSDLSVPIAVAFAAARPERVASLVLVGGAARLLDGPDYEVGLPAKARDHVVDELVAGWGSAEGVMAQLGVPGRGREADRQALARTQRLSVSPGAVRSVIELGFDLDVRALLPAVQAPTLVLHRAGDLLIPPEHARYLAEHIPNATYVELAGDDHFPFLGDAEALEGEIEAFVTGARPAPVEDRALVTLMFTDIVGSTERLASVGDRRWTDALDRHDATVREELARFRGREVNTAGDSFLAAFDGAGRAIRWAVAVRDRLAREGIPIRVGGHCGEVVLRGEDVSGIAVHLAARISAMSATGEILVSSTVKDLVAGSEMVFESRGAHNLKGVPGEWEVFALAAT
jgi:pimeloyl-ACP methyl ester carboxylesterase